MTNYATQYKEAADREAYHLPYELRLMWQDCYYEHYYGARRWHSSIIVFKDESVLFEMGDAISDVYDNWKDFVNEMVNVMQTKRKSPTDINEVVDWWDLLVYDSTVNEEFEYPDE